MSIVEVFELNLSGDSFTILNHNCEYLGHLVEICEDWKYCPWCGCGLTNSIKRALRDFNIEKAMSEADFGNGEISPAQEERKAALDHRGCP